MDQNQNKVPGLAVASLVLGIASFFFGFLVPSILAIVFANMSKKYTGGELCGYAKAGRTCGIISLVLTSVALLIVIIYCIAFVPYLSQLYNMYA